MPEHKWRVGYRPLGKALAEPTWTDGVFDSFEDADEFRATLQKTHAFHNEHCFVDCIPPGLILHNPDGTVTVVHPVKGWQPWA